MNNQIVQARRWQLHVGRALRRRHHAQARLSEVGGASVHERAQGGPMAAAQCGHGHFHQLQHSVHEQDAARARAAHQARRPQAHRCQVRRRHDLRPGLSQVAERQALAHSHQRQVSDVGRAIRGPEHLQGPLLAAEWRTGSLVQARRPSLQVGRAVREQHAVQDRVHAKGAHLASHFPQAPQARYHFAWPRQA